VKEVLFKLIFIVFFLNIFCFSENINPSTYDYVFNNYIPNKITKNNIGIKYSFKNNQKYILSQNWITNNLYIGGYFGSNNNQNEKINYTLNLGYKTDLSYFKDLKIIYDIGIHNKRSFSDYDSKWKKISIIINYNIFTLSYNYLLSNCNDSDILNLIDSCSNVDDIKNASFIGFDFYNLYTNNFFINFGLKKSKTSLFPYISLRYNL